MRLTEKKMTRTRKMRRRKKAEKRLSSEILSLIIEMSQSVTKIKVLIQCFLQKKSKDAKSRRDSNASDKFDFHIKLLESTLPTTLKFERLGYHGITETFTIYVIPDYNIHDSRTKPKVRG